MASTTVTAPSPSVRLAEGNGDSGEEITGAGRVLAAPNQPLGLKTNPLVPTIAVTMTPKKELSVAVQSHGPLPSRHASQTPQKRSMAQQSGKSPKFNKQNHHSTVHRSPLSSPLQNLEPTFPPLEGFDEIKRKRDTHYVGPTTESNWVLPGKVSLSSRGVA